MEKLLRDKQVSTIVSYQCEYGLLTPGPHGEPLPAKKPPKCASSSCHMLKRLSRRCKRDHTHQQLVGSRAKQAENYPLDLIVKILRGMRDTADFEEEWGDTNRGRHCAINDRIVDVPFTQVLKSGRGLPSQGLRGGDKARACRVQASKCEGRENHAELQRLLKG